MEIIRTNRLTIRTLTVNDLDDFYAYRSDPEVTKFQGYEPMTKEACTIFIQENLKKKLAPNDTWMQFGLEEIASQKLIGDCGIFISSDQPPYASIGISLHPEYQNKGFGKEMFKSIIQYLHKEFGVVKFKESIDPQNLKSKKLLLHIGFKKMENKDDLDQYEYLHCPESE